MGRNKIKRTLRRVGAESTLIKSVIEANHKDLKKMVEETTRSLIDYPFFAFDIAEVKYKGLKKTYSVDCLIGHNTPISEHLVADDILNILDEHSDALLIRLERIAEQNKMQTEVVVKQEDGGYTSDNIIGYFMQVEISQKHYCLPTDHFNTKEMAQAKFSYTIDENQIAHLQAIGDYSSVEFTYKHDNANMYEKAIVHDNQVQLVDADTWIEMNTTDTNGNKAQARVIILRNQEKKTGVSFDTFNQKTLYKN